MRKPADSDGLPADTVCMGNDAHEGAETAAGFAQMSRELDAQEGVQSTLLAICRLSVELIDGADHAGVTIVRAGQFSTPASTSELPGLVDRTQYSTNEGPCVDAIRNSEVVESADLAADPRWPQFTRTAVACSPVRSMLSFRLFTDEDTLGALNFYAERTHAFTETSRATGAVLATHAAIAWKAARDQELNENLQAALVSSRRIGIAIGILMAIRKVGETEAFELLRIKSQRTHRKVRDVADDVVFTGTLED